jgi:tetratricopeptide (TPR) repeat protein
MKPKCAKCGAGKPKRICHRENDAEICSACCASMRDIDCGNCIHYAEAQKHEAQRSRTAKPPAGPILMEVNPELDAAVDAALELAQQGNPSQARARLLSLWAAHPRSYALAFGMGVTHALQDHHQEALDWFDQAIAIDPYGIEAHYNKACAHQKRFEMVKCARAYQKVIQIGPPDDPEVARARSFLKDLASMVLKKEGLPFEDYLLSNEHFDHAFALMEAGDWQRALKSFRTSVAIHERNARCHGNMGICLANLGQKAAALAALDRALEIDPSYQPALSNRLLVEDMEEGQPLANTLTEVVNYRLDQFLKKQG